MESLDQSIDALKVSVDRMCVTVDHLRAENRELRALATKLAGVYTVDTDQAALLALVKQAQALLGASRAH